MGSQTDRRARFERIADDVYQPLQRYVRRRLAASEVDDVFADVMLTLWRRVDDIPDDQPLPWCYAVARNTLANHYRGRRRHLRLVGRLSAEPRPLASPDPAELAGDPELTQAMGTLPEADREVLYLWAWEQLEPREIAEVIGTTSNAVSLRLSRAKGRLADAITRQNAAAAGHISDHNTEEQG